MAASRDIAAHDGTDRCYREAGAMACSSSGSEQGWPALVSPGGFSHLKHARTPPPQLQQSKESSLETPRAPESESKKEQESFLATATPPASESKRQEEKESSLETPRAPESESKKEQESFLATATPPASESKRQEEKAHAVDPVKPGKKRRLSSSPAETLVKVPLETVSEPGAGRRPARSRMAPLAHWRNEGVVFERKPGSLLPTVAAVSLMPDEKDNHAQSDAADEDEDTHAQSDAADEDEEITPAKRKRSARASNFNDERSSKKALEPRQRTKRKSSGTPEVAIDLEAELLKAADAEDESHEAPAPSHRPPPKKAAKKMPVPPFIPSRGPSEGFHEMPMVDGSSQPCGIRIGLDQPGWTCCDIRVPPRSVSAAEKLTTGTAMVMHVIGAPKEENGFFASIDGKMLSLHKGDNFLIRAGSEYYLQNSSVADYVHVKMVLITR